MFGAPIDFGSNSSSGSKEAQAISNGPQLSPQQVQSTISRPPRCWPGFFVAAICTAVYVAVGMAGSAGPMRLQTSSFIHHNLTAYAWLHGRLYVTDDDVAKSFLLRRLNEYGRRVPVQLPTETLAGLLRETIRKQLDQRGPRQNQSRASTDEAAATVLNEQYQKFAREALSDWVTTSGRPIRHYAYWPPVPAVIMLIPVLLCGPNASDVLADNIIGGVTVLFVYLILAELACVWMNISTWFCAAMALLYGLGTVHMWQSCVGQVWFITAITGTMFLTISIWLALKAIRHPRFILGSAGALAAGFLSRNTIILATPFLFVALWMGIRTRRQAFADFVKLACATVGILAVASLSLLVFNKLRFGEYLEFGQGRLAFGGGNPRFSADYQMFGRFNKVFVTRNVFFYFLNPVMGFLMGRPHSFVAGRTFDPDGNSLFLISPALIYCWLAAGLRRSEPIRNEWALPAILIGFVAAQLSLVQEYANQMSDDRFRWPDHNHTIQIETAILAVTFVAFLVACIRQRDPLLMAVLAGAIPGTAALLMFHGTGFYAFGPRYILDVLPFLVILAAFGMRGRLSGWAIFLIVVSIAVNSWGTYRFRLEQF